MSQGGITSDKTSPGANVETLGGNFGGVTGPDASFNIQLSGTKSLGTVANGVAFAVDLFGSASYLVGSTADGMPYQTLTAAFAAAVADGASASVQKNVCAKPGSYSEPGLSLPAGVHLYALDRCVAEKGMASDSTVTSSVILTTTLTVGAANTQVLGVTFTPTSGSAALAFTTGNATQIVDCKIIANNAAAFTGTGGSAGMFSRCSIIPDSASTTHSLFSGVSGSMIFSFDDCKIDCLGAASSSAGICFMSFYGSTGNFFIDQSGKAPNFLMEIDGCEFGSDTHPFFRGDGTGKLFWTSKRSGIISTGTDAIVDPNALSTYYSDTCTFSGSLNIVTTSQTIINTCTNINNVSILTRTQGAGSVTLLSTGALNSSDVYFQAQSAIGAGEAYFVSGVTGVQAYSWGQDASGSNLLNFTQAAASTVSPATGSIILQYQPTPNVWKSSSKWDFNNSFSWSVTTPGAYPYSVLLSDIVVLVNTTSARSIVLPATSRAGQIHIIKDATGNATAQNITVTVSGGVKTIDGSASFLINADYDSATFIYDGTNFLVI